VGEEQTISVEALVERSGDGLARGPGGKGEVMGTYLYRSEIGDARSGTGV